ncbi:MAG: matrixin family metalloprotease, partial [Bacillota bacterium]|nr:matrixin family metalloprotease [Bacillota bacterium]
ESYNTLGKATYWHYQYQTDIIEADIVFNSSRSWSTAVPTPSGYIDLETVALHEFGHWLNLGHSDNQAAVMYYMYQGIRRSLHTDDIAGVLYIYGSAPCTVSIPTQPDGPAEGTVGIEYSYLTGGSVCSCGQPVQYRLRWKEQGDSTWTSSSWSSSSTLTLSFSEEGSYTLEAEARCSDTLETSDYSTPLTISISIPEPGEVILISPAEGVILSGDSVLFEWEAAEEASYYNLRVERVSDSTIIFDEDVGDVTAYAVNFPADESAGYRWQVTAGNAGGLGNPSVWRSFIIDNLPPEVDLESLVVAPVIVAEGESLEISVDAVEDFSGVAVVQVRFSSPSGKAFKEMTWESDTPGHLEVTVSESLYIESGDEEGRWLLEWIYAEDHVGNQVYLYRNDIVDPEMYDFYLGYDFSLTLGTGWSMLSLPRFAEVIDFNKDDVELWLTYGAGAWESGNRDQLIAALNNPARAVFIKAFHPLEIRVIWAELTPQVSFASYELKPGWNIIGSGIQADYSALLADVSFNGTGGISQIHAPNIYNSRKTIEFHLPWTNTLISLVTDSSSYREEMYPFDGYWVYLRGESRTYTTPIDGIIP